MVLSTRSSCGGGYARHDIRRGRASRDRSAFTLRGLGRQPSQVQLSGRQRAPAQPHRSGRRASACADVLGSSRAGFVAADSRAGLGGLDQDGLDALVGRSRGSGPGGFPRPGPRAGRLRARLPAGSGPLGAGRASAGSWCSVAVRSRALTIPRANPWAASSVGRLRAGAVRSGRVVDVDADVLGFHPQLLAV